MKRIVGIRYAIFARDKINWKDPVQALTRIGESWIVLKQKDGSKGRRFCWERQIRIKEREIHRFMPGPALPGQNHRRVKSVGIWPQEKQGKWTAWRQGNNLVRKEGRSEKTNKHEEYP